jgi:hypothetical protein
MLELEGWDYQSAPGWVAYNSERFRFFTGARERNQIFMVSSNQSGWEVADPGFDFHTEPDAGCYRWASKKITTGVYSLRTENLWSGEYSGLDDLVVEGIFVGAEPPTESVSGSSSSSTAPAGQPEALMKVHNCSSVNLEITKLVMIDGFPVILLDDCPPDKKSTAKIYNNMFVKATLAGTEEEVDGGEIPEPGSYFWDAWIPFGD